MKRQVVQLFYTFTTLVALSTMPASAQAQAFPEGAKIGFVNVLEISRESNEGQAAAEKVRSLTEQKVEELNAQNAGLQEQLQILQQSASAPDDPARVQLLNQIEQNQMQLRRAQLDAQMEMAELERQLINDFSRSLGPIIEQIAEERDLHLVLPVRSTFLWANPGLDLTDEVMERFNAGQ